MSGQLPGAAGLRLLADDPARPELLRLHSHDEHSTRALGELLGRLLPPGTLLALEGDLGSGKTVFAQGLALGLGVDRNAYVSSPSFIYVREHHGRLCFYHVDLYRIADPEELELIGLRDFLDRRSVCAVEWPDRVPGWLPEQGLRVRIRDEADAEGLGRCFELEPLDEEAAAVLAALRAALAAARAV
ncbi:MAG: tRNA (adenosine(37)-N6)-threonylcarbamoyltransferase complex ATPase subunit type 1 TsaE [Deltaproteobacteria bacterium]|nr:tRNA (adenosine(37)-N6)-threonylcarbamoyltransferase complex ATPase subunit type 1 TsaE [Deltaproteobacteria bacterium]